MHVVDATVWVSWLFPTDAFHDRSSAWIRQTVSRRTFLVAPVLLLPEVAGAVSRRSGQTSLGLEAVARLQRLRSLRLIALDSGLAELAVRSAAELHLRGADSVYVALTRRLGIPLVTWDEEQRERARHAVVTQTPEEALGT